MIDTTKTTVRKRNKSPNYSIGVRRALEIDSYLSLYNIRMKAFLSLLMIVNKFNEGKGHSSYTSVYDKLYLKRNGASQIAHKRSINRLAKKGLVRVDDGYFPIRLYPTEKALKEVSKFL